MTSRRVPFGAATLVVFVFQSGLTASTLFMDDFEGYPFSAPWTRKWNAVNDPANNGLHVDPSSNDNLVLKLYGESNFSASATQEVAYPNRFDLNLRVRNGTEPRPDTWGRGSVVLEDYVTLFTFYTDGTLNMGGITAPYQTDRWYDVRVLYDDNGGSPVAKYWLDGGYMGQAKLVIPNPTATLGRLELNAGSTAYFDDVRLNAIPEPTSLKLALLGVVGGLLLIPVIAGAERVQ
jgi:hypothetical protein